MKFFLSAFQKKPGSLKILGSVGAATKLFKKTLTGDNKSGSEKSQTLRDRGNRGKMGQL